MVAAARRLTAALAACAAGAFFPQDAQAGNAYGWTISHSSTDPFVNSSAPAFGTRNVYLWYACNTADGLVGADFALAYTGGLSSGSSFTPEPEFTRSGVGAQFSLASTAGCLSGPLLAGTLLILDSGTDGSVCVVDGPSGNVSRDCQPSPTAWPNQTIGYVTGAASPCADVLCLPPDSDLGVAKTVDDPAPGEGVDARYTIVAVNNGPDDANSVTVQDVLPSGITFVADSASHGSYDEGSGAWTIGALASGDTATLTIDFQPDAGTAGQTIWNRADILGTVNDGNAANDADSVSIMVGAILATFPAAGGAEGAAVNVMVNLTNDQSVSQATLHYREGGSGPFATEPLTQSSPGTWEATIPGAVVTGLGVQYYAEIVPQSASAVRFPAAGFQSLQVDLTPRSVALPQGAFRMISLPFEGEAGGNPAALFDELGTYDTKRWRYGVWDGSAYREGPQAAGALHPGTSAWIYDRNGTTVSMGGSSTDLSQDRVVTLHPGWNMVANPFGFALPADQVVLGAGVADDFVAYQGGGYVHGSASLAPEEGYWIHNANASASSLTFPVDPQPAVRSPRARTWMRAADEPGWSVDVHAVSGSHRDPANRLGTRPAATAGVDELDLLDAPAPPGAHLMASFVDASGTALQVDTRPFSGEGAVWKLRIDRQGTSEAVVLDFDGVRSVPADHRILLVDEKGLVRHDLRERSRVTGLPPGHQGAVTWIVAVGSERFVQERAEEASLRAAQSGRLHLSVAPNPFRAGEGVTFSVILSGHGPVELTIQDIGGRRVATLQRGPLQVGMHRFSWDGRDHAGRPVATGVYFVRAEQGASRDLRKVILLH